MNMWALFGVLALVASTVGGAEPMEATQKDKRIARTKHEIQDCENVLKAHPPAWYKSLADRGLTAAAERDRRADEKAKAALPPLRTELAWLEGQITAAGAEKNVKALEESLAKVKDGDPARAGIEAALAEARRVSEQVKKLEADKDF